MEGDFLKVLFIDKVKCGVYRIVGGIALGREGKINSNFSEWYTNLWHSKLFCSLKGGSCDRECLRIGKSNVLSSENSQSSSDIFWIFSPRKHLCEPIYRCVWIATSDTFDHSRNGVVFIFGFVVGFIRWDQVFYLFKAEILINFADKFQKIDRRSCISLGTF